MDIISIRFLFILWVKEAHKKDNKRATDCRKPKQSKYFLGHVENIRRETAEEEKERSSMSNNV